MEQNWETTPKDANILLNKNGVYLSIFFLKLFWHHDFLLLVSSQGGSIEFLHKERHLFSAPG